MDAYERFKSDVMKSEAMQEEIRALGSDLEKVIAYANEKGYAFTFEDIKDEIAGESELSEESLDQVSGGRLNVVAGVASDVSSQASAAFRVVAGGIVVF